MSFQEFAKKEIKEVFEELKSKEIGLGEREAEERQKIYGLNEIKEKEIGVFEIFLRQIKSIFFYLLFIAGIISLFVGEKINGILIFIFAFINVILGFFQEYRAQRAISLLKEYLPKAVEVLREGKGEFIDKKFLVPGDIVLLDSGDIVPADLRIIEARNLLIDESILTGESEPVVKISKKIEAKEIFEAKNIVFSGTSVISGKAKGIVISTGRNTEFGRVAKLTAEVKKPSVYERELKDFSRIILRIVIFTILVVYLIDLLIKKEPNPVDFAIFCLALIVGIIPEPLPVVVGSSLSRGALRLARRKVVVKRLASIEDLGNMEILCADKTGTLTENKLKVDKIYSVDPKKCLFFSLLTSSLLEKTIMRNPFDLAILEKEKEREKTKNFKLLFEIPFDPARRRNTVLVENEQRILISRGAPEEILERSSEIEDNLKMEEIKENLKKEGKEGKRILAIGYKFFEKNEFSEGDEKDFKFLGFITFIDPLRKTAKQTINLTKKLGVQIKILTGDSLEVSGKVAMDVGLIDNPKKVILGKDLENLSEADFDRKCEEFSVFARVLPETKLKIIKALQKKYEVGFMGEGINDAPSLKIAHVAIAVKGAADVSKEAADILLTENDLRIVIGGIREGRNIFANINKYIKTTLSSNFGNFYSVATMSLILPFLPMLPPQILLVNILSDLPLVSISFDNVGIEELRKPKVYKLNQLLPLIFLLAIISSIFDFAFLGIFWGKGENQIQTGWFLMSIFTEILLIFSVRTREFFLATKAPVPILIFSSIFASLIALILPFTNFGKHFLKLVSPALSSLLTIFSLILAYLFANEVLKQIYYSRLRR